MRASWILESSRALAPLLSEAQFHARYPYLLQEDVPQTLVLSEVKFFKADGERNGQSHMPAHAHARTGDNGWRYGCDQAAAGMLFFLWREHALLVTKMGPAIWGSEEERKG